MKNIFVNQHQRTILAGKNIIASIIIKGLSIIISLMLVPMTISYLNIAEYGIWLTLSSVVGWISFFDIGLMNGLRNRLTIAIVKKDNDLAKAYISTTFALISIIMISVFMLFIISNQFLNWREILKISDEYNYNFNQLMLIIFAFFCFSFVFRLIGIVLISNQLPAGNDLIAFIGNALSFFVIFILTKTTNGSLFYISITFSMIPALIYLLSHLILFNSKYKHISPSFSFINFDYTKDLMSLGLKFFIVQISGLVIFSLSNVLIIRWFGPEEVAKYNIAFKYFNVVNMGFNIIVAPFWSATTEALEKKDNNWVKSAIKKLLILWFIVVIGVIVMVVISNFIYSIWVGPDVEIPISISIVCAIYVVIRGWNAIFSFIIAGTGKMKLSTFVSMFNMVFYIPLAILLAKLVGVGGVLLATSVIMFGGSILTPIQAYLILNNKSKGIWNA